MSKYDFDSYTLYEIKKRNVFSVKIRVTLKEPVNGDILQVSAAKAFTRFPYYCRTVAVDSNGGYVLESCDQPIAVIRGDKAVKLGTEETNRLFFAVTFENNDIFFSFAHNFCGACGAMRWIKATLWQYLTDAGHDVDKTGIMTTDTPITAEEQAQPDVDSLPVEEPLGNFNFTKDSFTTMNDYIERMRDPNGINGYYPVKIPKKALMKYARDNDGSPNSILAATMFKMCVKAVPDESKFTVGITNNYRADVGCPETYRDILRQMYVQYDIGMKDWPIEKLSTVTRSRMYLQMQPELSWDKCRKVEELRTQIDAQPDLDSKAGYALDNSLTTHGLPSSFYISYVGRVEWGGLASYIDAVYTLTFGHLLVEVNATEEDFFLTFQTVRKDDKYLKEFLEVLDEEGIAYSVENLMERRIPAIILP